MSSPSYRARRATLDDLDTLRNLWKSMRFDEPDLERRLTEFQVAVGTDGKVAGAVGFQVTGRHGLIHSEAFEDFSNSDALRAALWTRVQSLCTNHGVARLWTREEAPFWSHTGFQRANDDALQKLPAAWNRGGSGWFTLQLKDDQVIASLEKEFALFKESEKARTAETLDQTRKLKMILTGIGFLIAAALAVAAVYLVLTRRPPGSFGP